MSRVVLGLGAQIVVVVYDERQMPDGPDMTAVLGMFEEQPAIASSN